MAHHTSTVGAQQYGAAWWEPVSFCQVRSPELNAECHSKPSCALRPLFMESLSSELQSSGWKVEWMEKNRKFEGERKPGIKVWQSQNFLVWQLKFSRLVLYTWEHRLFQLKYGLPRKTTYFACDTSNINHNRRLFICHHPCLLESHFGLGFREEFQDELLSFFTWVVLQTSGDCTTTQLLAKQTRHSFKVFLHPIFMLYYNQR